MPDLTPVISISKIAVTVAAVGPQGSTGATGPAGSGDTQQYTAGMTLSALRMLTLDASGNAVYANSGDPTVGMSLTATTSGDLVTVATSDHVVEDSSWSWSAGAALFNAGNGALTATPPTSGVWQVVGVAISATRIVVQIGDPIAM